jgi:undecaprenyl-diphosphatase
MISPKIQIKRKHYTVGLAIILVALFIGLYLLIGPLQGFDTNAVTYFPIQFPGLDGFMLAVTTIGSPIPIVLLALSWAGIEYAWKRRDRALIMIASLAAAPVFYLLKELFHRHRPLTQYASSLGLHSYSFPSGHATMSFSVLLTLAYLVSFRLPKVWSRVITGLLIVVVVFIGVSRVYLGAHYPTDVIGGWLVGGLVLILLRAYVSGYEHITETTVKA